MADSIMFKSSMFGFDKTDVMNYIEQIQRAKMASDKYALVVKGQFEAMQEELDALKQSVNSAPPIDEGILKNIELLKNENANLKEEIESLKRDCLKLREIESQVGGLVINAQLNSQKIIDDASKNADSILNNSQSIINDAITKITDLKNYLERSEEDLCATVAVNINIKEENLNPITFTDSLQYFINAEQNFEATNV